MIHPLLWLDADPTPASSSRFSFICVFNSRRGSAKAIAVCVDHAPSHIDEEDGAFLGPIVSSATLAQGILAKSTPPPESNSTNTKQSHDDTKKGSRQERDQNCETKERDAGLKKTGNINFCSGLTKNVLHPSLPTVFRYQLAKSKSRPLSPHKSS
ncbi:hypothetical protein BKA80DRAFT_284188 [Phyllosticta citrichinensis]